MPLKLIIGFLPWILFGLLAHHNPKVAMLTALVTSTIIFIVNIRCIKIVELAGFLFFSILVVLLLVFKMMKLAPYTGLMVHSALSAIAWGSLLLGVPFTIQYARETVEEKYWETPLFIRINQIITAAWGINFVCSAIIGELIAIGRWAYWGWVSVFLSVITILFTLRFPAWYRARMVQKGEAGTSTRAAEPE